MAAVTFISILSEVRSCYTKLKLEEKHLSHLGFEPKGWFELQVSYYMATDIFREPNPKLLAKLDSSEESRGSTYVIDLSLYGCREALMYYN